MSARRAGMTLLAGATLQARAWAAVPLVHDGDPDEAVAFAAARTGLPLDQFEPVELSGLLGGLPITTGGATLRHCSGAPTKASTLRGHAIRAEAAHRDGDHRAAMDQLDIGIAGLGCLDERVDTKVATRMFLLRGGLLAHEEQLVAARAELQSALSISPDVAWDEWLPSAGRAIFESLQADTQRVQLGLAPAGAPAAPAVDGHTAPFSLRPGLHLVQIPSAAGLRSAWLTIERDATLVVPDGFRRPVLDGLADADKSTDVVALLHAARPEEAVYATHAGGLWLISVEDGPVLSTLVAPAPVEPEDAGQKGRRRGR